MNLVDQSAFVVGLESVNLAIAGRRLVFHLILDLVEGDGTIHLGFAFPQSIEVGAVEESNLLHLDWN